MAGAAPLDRPLSLFDAHFLLPFEDRFTRASFEEQFFDNRWEAGRFLRNSLLYDTLYLPTVSLLVVPLLLKILGHGRLVEALETGSIVLARYRGAIGYGGNGEGLTLRQVRAHIDGSLNAEAGRAWAPTDEVLAELGERFAPAGSALASKWSAVERTVLDRVIEVDGTDFGPVARATSDEVRGNDAIRDLFKISSERLSALPGVAEDQVRWLAADRLIDEVDALLHLAQDAFEAYLAGKVGALDRTTGSGAPRLLDARASRAGCVPTSRRRLSRLLVLRRVPAFAAAHGDDEMIARIWRARASREAATFRRWFHEQVLERPGEAEARFAETLVRPILGDDDTVRPLGFLAPETASAKLMIDTARGVLPDPVQVAPRVQRSKQVRFTMKRARRLEG